MSATQKRPGDAADRDDALDDPFPPPIPDEYGPHDVPDDKVIEKTLPTAPPTDTDDGGPTQAGS